MSNFCHVCNKNYKGKLGDRREEEKHERTELHKRNEWKGRRLEAGKRAVNLEQEMDRRLAARREQETCETGSDNEAPTRWYDLVCSQRDLRALGKVYLETQTQITPSDTNTRWFFPTGLAKEVARTPVADVMREKAEEGDEMKSDPELAPELERERVWCDEETWKYLRCLHSVKEKSFSKTHQLFVDAKWLAKDILQPSEWDDVDDVIETDSEEEDFLFFLVDDNANYRKRTEASEFAEEDRKQYRVLRADFKDCSLKSKEERLYAMVLKGNSYILQTLVIPEFEDNEDYKSLCQNVDTQLEQRLVEDQTTISSEGRERAEQPKAEGRKEKLKIEKTSERLKEQTSGRSDEEKQQETKAETVPKDDAMNVSRDSDGQAPSQEKPAGPSSTVDTTATTTTTITESVETTTTTTTTTESVEPTTTTIESVEPTTTTTESVEPTTTTTESAEPTTTTTESAELTTTTTESVEPTTTATELAEPTTTITESVEPTTTTTESVEPTTMTTESDESTTTTTESVEPTATTTEAVEPTATTTESVEPTTTATELAEPTTTITESAEPTTTTTESVEPTRTTESVKLTSTTTTTTESVEPTTTTTEAVEPTTTTTESVEPTATTTEAVEPTTTITESVEPTTTTPESAEPTTTTPESVEPTTTTTESVEPTRTTTESVEPTRTTESVKLTSTTTTTTESVEPTTTTTESVEPTTTTTESVEPISTTISPKLTETTTTTTTTTTSTLESVDSTSATNSSESSDTTTTTTAESEYAQILSGLDAISEQMKANMAGMGDDYTARKQELSQLAKGTRSLCQELAEMRAEFRQEWQALEEKLKAENKQMEARIDEHGCSLTEKLGGVLSDLEAVSKKRKQ